MEFLSKIFGAEPEAEKRNKFKEFVKFVKLIYISIDK